ncbi:SDR family NAD(P)-dependent oxidoreductase [Amycolatopsis sp. H6(2020)]|nr:SDR family NAD(P)-dependent oxidoreductase [Amycolatopsis sp. H6(2020)]
MCWQTSTGARLDDAARELAEAGVEAIGVVCDITDKASVEQLFQRAESEGSHVRAVVHAAGVSPRMGTAERIARINATGTVNIARAFLARAADAFPGSSSRSVLSALPSNDPTTSRKRSSVARGSSAES